MKGASIMECIRRLVQLDVSKGRIAVAVDWETRPARYHYVFPNDSRLRDATIALRDAGDRT